MIDAQTWRQMELAIWRIHESTDEVQMRTRFLEDVAPLVPHRISFFDLVGDNRGRQGFFSPLSLTLGAKELNSYYDTYIDMDYTTWVQNQPGSRPVYRDSDFINEDAQLHSTLYREWLEPMGVVYGCSVIVGDAECDWGTVTFGRAREQGDFTEDEMEVLRVLERHLALRFSQLAPTGFSFGRDSAQKRDLAGEYRLTRRESEVAQLLCRGTSTEQIAASLCISPHTVSRHTANIYKKVGVGSRIDLMNLLGRAGGLEQ